MRCPKRLPAARGVLCVRMQLGGEEGGQGSDEEGDPDKKQERMGLTPDWLIVSGRREGGGAGRER